MSSLHEACKRGDLDVIEKCLDEGEDVNSQDDLGLTPLHHAVDLTVLCRWFTDVLNYQDEETIFKRASDVSGVMTKLLINKGASVNLEDNKKRTPLHIASVEKNDRALAVLLNCNADVNMLDDNGRTALHYCASSGSVECARQLIEKGCDVNAADLDAQIALHLAVDEGHLNAVKLLLQYGSNINAANKFLQTPFLLSINHEVEIITLLLNSGANANDVDNFGQTALHLSVENAEALDALLNHPLCTDLNVRDHNGDTALHLATLTNDCNIVKLLLLHGADVDSHNFGAETPLHNVIIHLYDSEYPELEFDVYYRSRLRMISTLLNHNADLTSASFTTRSSFDIVISCDLFPPVKEAVVAHVCKLKVAGVAFGKTAIDSLVPPLDPSFFDRCVREIRLMKNKTIGDVSFYRLLTVRLYHLVFYLRNPEIEESLSQGSYKQFPLYSDLLETRFSLAAHRKQLNVFGEIFFYTVLHLNAILTHDCIECILSYLSLKDLKVLSHLCL